MLGMFELLVVILEEKTIPLLEMALEAGPILD